MAAPASDHPWFSPAFGMWTLSRVGAVRWVQKPAEPGTGKHPSQLGGCQERRRPREHLGDPGTSPIPRGRPQEHCLLVQAEFGGGEGPVEAAPESQASAALCCMLGIDSPELQGWPRSRGVRRANFPVPRPCKGLLVAGCPGALGGNVMSHCCK